MIEVLEDSYGVTCDALDSAESATTKGSNADGIYVSGSVSNIALEQLKPGRNWAIGKATRSGVTAVKDRC
jgi:hypothetical protein